MALRWLTVDLVVALHSEAVSAFGGSPGIRDWGLLESAVDRPRNLHTHGEDPTDFELAAAYCVGIVKNHPCIDGNKRVGYIGAHTFLELNGYAFEPAEAEIAAVILALASGEMDELALAHWLAENATRRAC